MLRRMAIACLFVLLAALAAASVRADSAPATSREDEKEIYELQKLLVDTLDQVKRNYVREIDRRELVEAAIRGILEDLDPYSSYINREEMRDFQTAVEREFGGIGIQIAVEAGQLKVVSPLAGTPAYRAGIVAGDQIVEIEGKSTTGITLSEAVERLKGEAGTKVTLTVVHPGSSAKKEITLSREVIHIATVLGDHRKPDGTWDFMLDAEKQIGYIRITAFSRNTAAELRAALTNLQKGKLAGLILDLRSNPGGLLTSGVEVADLFLSSGRIVSVEGRNSPSRTWESHAPGTFEGFPMAVLVNRYSASASEIVAACLQDHHRAVIIGERTWGKGSVQNVISMENHRSALKLTTASYHRPSGKNIHRFPNATDDDEWGVMPDAGYLLRLTNAEMRALNADRRRRDVLRSEPEAETLGSVERIADDPAEPVSDPAAAHEEGKPVADDAKSENSEFVDPHIRMAIDYLAGETTDEAVESSDEG